MPAKSAHAGAPNQTRHTDPACPAQRGADIGEPTIEESFHNNITSIITSHQKHVTADSVDV